MSFEKLLARSYAPLNFITIHGYPNLLPATSKWLDFLPRLDGNGDSAKQHLEDFYTFAENFELQHEDMMMKIFFKDLVWGCQRIPIPLCLEEGGIDSMSTFETIFMNS